MFRKRIGIDLGTANTVFVAEGNSVVLDQPSVVAIQRLNGKTKVVAVGEPARLMLVKTPKSIEASTPLRDGVIANFEVAERMIDAFFRAAVPASRFLKPVVIVCVPYGATAVEKRAIQQTILSAGAKRVGLVEEPMAAAMGANLPVFAPKGSMIVDIGGGTTEIAVISLGGIVCASSIRLAGNHFDRTIVDTVRKKLDLIIGLPMAERIKLEVVTAREDIEKGAEAIRSMEVRGIDSKTGIPKAITVNSTHFTTAVTALVNAIEGEIRSVLDRAPPDLASDIHSAGIMLTGGGALLRDLPLALAKRVEIPVTLAEQPKLSVAFGTGLAVQFEKQFINAIQFNP